MYKHKQVRLSYKKVIKIIRRLKPPLSSHFDQIHAARRISRLERHQDGGNIDTLGQDFRNFRGFDRLTGQNDTLEGVDEHTVELATLVAKTGRQKASDIRTIDGLASAAADDADD